MSGARRRQLGTLLLLASAAVGLVLYSYFGVVRGDERAAARRASAERVFPRADGVDAGVEASLQFVSLEVQAKGDRTALERSDGGWRLVAPFEGPADEDTVQSLLHQLRTARFKSVVQAEPTAADLERFGLVPPRFRVRAVARLNGEHGSEKEKLTLKGGVENPFDGSVFVQRDEAATVYAAEGSARWAFEKSTFELRDKALLDFDPKHVVRVEVAGDDGLRLVRTGPKAWRLERPIQGGADEKAVLRMLALLRSERALAFIPDTPRAREELGLGAPTQDVTFTLEDGGTARLRLSRIDVDGEEKIFGLRESGAESALLELAPTALSPLSRPAHELRDRRALQFDRGQVARLELSAPGGSSLVVARDVSDAGASDDWRVLAPRPGPAKQWRLSALLWTLETLKASELGEARPEDWGRYGVTPRSRSITLKDVRGAVLARLVLGTPVPESPGRIYARGDGDQLLQLDERRIEALPGGLADLLDSPGGPDGG